jgi:hypothetical protein
MDEVCKRTPSYLEHLQAYVKIELEMQANNTKVLHLGNYLLTGR